MTPTMALAIAALAALAGAVYAGLLILFSLVQLILRAYDALFGDDRPAHEESPP